MLAILKDIHELLSDRAFPIWIRIGLLFSATVGFLISCVAFASMIGLIYTYWFGDLKEIWHWIAAFSTSTPLTLVNSLFFNICKFHAEKYFN